MNAWNTFAFGSRNDDDRGVPAGMLDAGTEEQPGVVEGVGVIRNLTGPTPGVTFCRHSSIRDGLYTAVVPGIARSSFTASYSAFRARPASAPTT